MMDFELGLYQVYTNDEFGFFEIKKSRSLLDKRTGFSLFNLFSSRDMQYQKVYFNISINSIAKSVTFEFSQNYRIASLC